MIYDIVVVGAGPAGATFCREVAGDKKVLLVDGQSEYTKKPCGGLLAPDAQKVLANFDLVLPKSVLVDPQIFSVKVIDLKTEKIRYYQRHYLNMDRYEFDRWLVSLVPDSVDIIDGKCIKVNREGELFVLEVSSNGERKQIKSKQIVGADGANSIVRRSFFDRKIYYYVAIQEWFNYPSKKVPFYSCIFDPKTSESCSWTIHKDEHLIFGGCFAKENCRENYEEQKQRLSKFLKHDFGEPVKREACITYRPKSFKDFITGENDVYLIGEAAGFISASSFEGISSAIKSGTLLAEAFKNNNTSNNIARVYKKSAFSLKVKMYLKTFKRWFMYTPILRDVIMRLGIEAIEVRQ